MDASETIGGEANFELVKQFVKSVFHSFWKSGGVRYGLVVFGNDDVKVFIPFYQRIIES